MTNERTIEAGNLPVVTITDETYLLSVTGKAKVGDLRGHLAVQSVVDALIAELHSEIDSVATRDFLRELVAEHISTNTLGADYITANTLNVSGELRAENKKIYFGTGTDAYIELDSNGYFRFPKKVYFDGGVGE